MKHLARLAMLALAVSAGLAAAQQKGPVTVGSKLDAEGRLLGSMIRLVLENAGFSVNDRTGTGTTPIVRKALLEGQIDIYPEYTGTAINNFFQGQTIPNGTASNAARSYSLVKSLDLKLNKVEWLGRAPANNTFAIAVPKALADKEKLASLADLAGYLKNGGAFKLVGSQEFFERDDALKSFEKTYGFTVKADQKIVLANATTAQTESAAAQGTNGANAAMAYGTDGSLAALNLVVLADPKGAQPVYQPAPTVRAEVLQKYPQIRTLLDPIFKTLDLPTLQGLNRQIDLDGKNPLEVARAFLKSKNYIKYASRLERRASPPRSGSRALRGGP
jgi:osmoprotectant transport system substrate-binding protein